MYKLRYRVNVTFKDHTVLFEQAHEYRAPKIENFDGHYS